MQKIWVKHYPTGIPHVINPDKYHSLSELFEIKVAQYHSNTAYTNAGISITYQELEEYSRHFANFLLQNLLLEPGARVGIFMPNTLQFPVVFWGTLRAGLLPVNINPLYTPAELESILEDSGLETIVVLTQFAHVIEKVVAFRPIKHIILTEFSDLFPSAKRILSSFYLKYICQQVPTYDLPQAISFREGLLFGKTVSFRPYAVTAEDTALLQYTAGTTGKPKGVMLTHRNLLANIEQALAWTSPILGEHEIFVTALPLYHIFSLTANIFIPLSLGANNILITNPRNMKHFIDDIAESGFTVITGVNTLFKNLMKQDAFQKINFNSLKIALSGGMALQKRVAETWLNLTHKPLIEAYGLSETSPGIAMQPVNFTGHYTGSVGFPWPSTEINIRSPAGESLPFNEIGEIWVRGPQVMKGYWNNKAATKLVLTSDGWFNTEDLGKMDEQGLLYVIERTKDMIIVSGFNVYPTEIENVIIKHPEVLDVGVVGIRDREQQEIIKAYIVRRNPALTKDNIISYCKLYLTPYKVPKIIEFCETLPKSNLGKVLRKDLRDSGGG